MPLFTWRAVNGGCKAVLCYKNKQGEQNRARCDITVNLSIAVLPPCVLCVFLVAFLVFTLLQRAVVQCAHHWYQGKYRGNYGAAIAEKSRKMPFATTVFSKTDTVFL